MLTAMEVHQLPPALLRSGRIELWLEMKLPDEAARAAILRQHLADWPAEQETIDVAALAEQTPGFTGADLKRLAEDGKNLFGYDLALGKTPGEALDYFLAAVENIRQNKARYEEAESVARNGSRRERNRDGISVASS
jgi:transitional endoplasmic reticulum ATPase